MKANPINPEYQSNAVSLYAPSSDALEDFPVLKAFQQYIDAEQAKARKRLLAMGCFFGALMLFVIAIFVGLLMSVSNRNQLLNDRLVEFAMKDRSTGSAVVVQSPQDNVALLALTSKLDELQRKILEAQNKAEAAKAVAETSNTTRPATMVPVSEKPCHPSAEELEIRRLQALLKAEKEKNAAEQKRRREEELEAYRRKHYPELYAPKKALKVPNTRQKTPLPATHDVIDQILDDLDRIEDEDEINDDEQHFVETENGTAPDSAEESLTPINYFDDDEKESMKPTQKKPLRKSTKTSKKKATSPLPETDTHAISVKNGDACVDWGIPD